MIRDRRLTPEEAATYRAVREQVAADLPELVARHHDRGAAVVVGRVVGELRAAREAQGLSPADLTERTGVAVAELEADPSPNPTVEVLARYADAVGKRLVVTLADR